MQNATLSPSLWETLKASTSDKAGVSHALATTIAEGIMQPNRSIPDNEYKLAAAAEITKVMETHAGAPVEKNVTVISECVRVFRQRYGGLSIREIRTAFDLAATGEIEANFKAYGGVFTVGIFADVMTSYQRFRRKVHDAIMKEKDKHEAQEHERRHVERHDKFKSDVYDHFEQLRISNNLIQSPEQINLGWVKVLSKTRQLELGHPNSEAWIQAKMDVLTTWRESVRTRKYDWTLEQIKVQKRAYEISSQNDFFPEFLRNKATNLYWRRLIFAALAQYSKPDGE